LRPHEGTKRSDRRDMTPPAATMAAPDYSGAAILITGKPSALRGGEVQN